MSDSRPHLVAVPDGSEAGAEAQAPARPERRGPTVMAALLFLAAVITASGWVLQSRETARAEARLEAARGELAATRSALAASEARVEAHREQLGAVRGQVADLVSGITALERLVARDPAPAPEAP